MSKGIDRSIIGLLVKGKNTNFGEITDLIEVNHDNEIVIVAVMSSGKSLSLDSIRKLFISQNLTLKRDEKGNCIPIVFPDGSAYSKYAVGTKRKQLAHPVCVANISNIADINGERISLTKLINSNDAIKYERI